MKFLITLTALGLTLPAYSQGSLIPHCVDLESSTISQNLYQRDIAISNDRSLVAGNDNKEGKLFLWDANTGKLIKSKHYTDLRTTTWSSLNISSSGHYVYYTNLERPKEYKTPHDNQTFFWNTKTSTISPLECGHCSGHISELSLNKDETVAYVKSGAVRNHYHQGLCGITEQKSIACEHTEDFSQQTEKLFETFKDKPDDQDKTSPNSKYLIPGGYPKDKDYQDKHPVYKFDQYLISIAEDKYSYDNGLLLVFNWKTKEGTLLNVKGSLADGFSPIRVGNRHLILNFKDYSREPTSTLEVYDFYNKTLERLSGKDEAVYIQQVNTNRSITSVAYVTQSQDKKRLQYCSVQRP